MLEPSSVVMYVESVAKSCEFYQDLLSINPAYTSKTFSTFKMSNGMGMGLWQKEAVVPKVGENGGHELAFAVEDNQAVDALFARWKAKGLRIAQEPTEMGFGYTFTVLDPDNNRLRVMSLV